MLVSNTYPISIFVNWWIPLFLPTPVGPLFCRSYPISGYYISPNCFCFFFPILVLTLHVD
jgi:hypothetical protein